MLDGLQARLGMSTESRRFADIDAARDLQDISDPETTTDESHTSIREWALQHPGWAIAAGIVIIVTGGLLLRWSAQLAVGVLTSPWTYAAIVAALVLAWIYRYGWRRRDAQITGYDELELKIGGSNTALKGTEVEVPGRANVFIPIKGWSGILSKPRPYQNEEIAVGMNTSFDPRDVDSEGAAVIRLEPGARGQLIGKSETDWGGTRIVQETAGLEPANGNYSSLRCTLPEFDDQRVDGLRERVEQLIDDLNDARDEINALERRNRNLTEKMHEPIDEQMDNRIEQTRALADIAHGRDRRRSSGGDSPPIEPREDFRGNGSMSADQSVLQQVEEEVSDDDDD